MQAVSLQQFLGAGLRDPGACCAPPRPAGLVPATALGWAPAPICAGGASVPSLPAQPFLWEGAGTSPAKPSCYHLLWLCVWSDFSCRERRDGGDLGV